MNKEITAIKAPKMLLNIVRAKGDMSEIITDALISYLKTDKVNKSVRYLEQRLRGRNLKEEDIKKAVCNAFHVAYDDLSSDHRKKHKVEARSAAYRIFRNYLKYSFYNIGIEFDKNHATVLHSYNKFDIYMTCNIFRAKYKSMLCELISC